MEYHEIEFEFEGLQGTVVGNTVFYGGDEFSREDATHRLNDAIDEAVEDYLDCMAWNKALMALATKWVDNGRLQSHGYDNN